MNKQLLPVLGGLVVALVLPLAVSAMDADELIAKHLEAVGGAEKLQALKSTRFTGKIQTMGMEFPFTVTHKRGKKMRVDSNVQGADFIQAFDGENGWSVNPMTGSQEPQDMPEIAEKIFAHEASMDGLLIDYAAKGYTATYVGEDEVEGTPVHHLKLETGDDITYDMYFDSEYFMLIKQSRKVMMDEREMTEDSFYGDFQEVEGLVLPYSVEQRQGGQTTSQIMVENAEFDVEVADDFFVKPTAETVEEDG